MQDPGKSHTFHSEESGSGTHGCRRLWRRFLSASPSATHCLAATAALASLLALIFVCLFAASRAHQRPLDTDICLTLPDCLSVAATAAQRMNVSVEPCADFYNYACGGYVGDGNLLVEMELNAKRKLARSLINVWNGDAATAASWQAKLRKFYARCEENYDTLSYAENPLLQAMRTSGIGDFLLRNSRSRNMSDLFRVVSGRFHVHSLFAARTAWSDYLHRGGGERRYAIWVGMNSRSEAMYVPQEKEHYRSLIEDVANLLVRDSAAATNGNNQTTRVDTFASDVLYVEDQLLQIHEDVLHNARISEVSSDHPANLAKVSELTNRMSAYIDFRDYLTDIYKPEVVIRNETQVLISDWYYVDRLRNLFDRMRSNNSIEFNRKIENYLTWSLIAFFQWDLSGEYRLRFAAYRRIIWPSNGLAAGAAATDCLETVRWGMNQALSALFVRNNFGPGDRDRASALFEQMRQAAKDGIDRISWMDAMTKLLAKQRVDSIVEKSGYPDEAWSDSYLDAEFRSIDPSIGSYFSLIVSCINYWKSLQARLLTRPYNPRDFQHWGQLWEASLDYRPYDRELLAQAGALQIPLFPSAGLPQLLAYSGAGSVMAHEILQSFDFTSHAYEAKRTRGWWSDATVSEYLKRASCVLDIHKVEHSAHQRLLESNWTAREMAAVLLARHQLDVHKLGKQVEKRLPLFEHTTEQLFYIFYMQKFCHRRGANSLERRAGRGADWRRGLGGEFQEAGRNQDYDSVLIPGQALANAVLANAPGFSQAFSCSPGSRMNPDPWRRCSLY